MLRSLEEATDRKLCWKPSVRVPACAVRVATAVCPTVHETLKEALDNTKRDAKHGDTLLFKQWGLPAKDPGPLPPLVFKDKKE